LDKNIFADLSKLQELNLCENKIQTLEKDIFAGLKKPQVLSLVFDAKVMRLYNKMFSPMPELEAIRLGENELDEQIFEDLRKMLPSAEVTKRAY
jgi:hypothetical protein